MKPDPESHALELRAQQLRASSGPGLTFHCAKCKQRRGIVGRRRLGGVWCCGACVACVDQAQETA